MNELKFSLFSNHKPDQHLKTVCTMPFNKSLRLYLKI